MAKPAAQAKRHSEAFKQVAVGNWIKMDLGSRKIVGWATAATLHGKALEMALQNRQLARGCLHHRDRGVPYACGE